MRLRGGSMRGCSAMERLVLDTSVLIEYIILRSKYREKVIRLFDLADEGRFELYVSPITLSELLYVASRIYQLAGLSNPNEEAINYLKWIEKRTTILDMSEDLIFKAGELKKLLGIALPDCYVIAAARAIKANPLFKTIEKEMEPVKNELKILGVNFLVDMEI